MTGGQVLIRRPHQAVTTHTGRGRMVEGNRGEGGWMGSSCCPDINRTSLYIITPITGYQLPLYSRTPIESFFLFYNDCVSCDHIAMEVHRKVIEVGVAGVAVALGYFRNLFFVTVTPIATGFSNAY